MPVTSTPAATTSTAISQCVRIDFYGLERIAINLERIDEPGPILQPRESGDSRTRGFIEMYRLERLFGDRVPVQPGRKGRVYKGLIRVEVGAGPPDVLRNFYMRCRDPDSQIVQLLNARLGHLASSTRRTLTG